MSPAQPHRVLHIVGSRQDDGGILSVVRQTGSGGKDFRHHVLVREGFIERRTPPLALVESRWLAAESDNHFALFLRGFAAAFEIRQLQRRQGYQVLHAHSRGGFAAMMVLASLPGKTPFVFTNHAYARRTGMYRKGAMRRNMTTVVLTPAMASHYGLEPVPGHIEIIPACCPDSLFDGALPPRSQPSPRLRLIGVGNLVRWKKWNLVLDAMGRLPVPLRQRLHFTLWGPTPDDPDSKAFATELKSQIGALGLAPYVRLAGPTNEVRAAVEASDIFVLPSTNEPCSVALIEALALGKPAVVSASGGNVDIVQPGKTGRLFKADDPEDLARQLAGFAEGDWVSSTPEQIRESVRHHSATAVWTKYHDLYRRLLARRPAT